MYIPDIFPPLPRPRPLRFALWMWSVFENEVSLLAAALLSSLSTFWQISSPSLSDSAGPLKLVTLYSSISSNMVRGSLSASLLVLITAFSSASLLWSSPSALNLENEFKENLLFSPDLLIAKLDGVSNLSTNVLLGSSSLVLNDGSLGSVFLIDVCLLCRNLFAMAAILLVLLWSSSSPNASLNGCVGSSPAIRKADI